MPAQCYRDTQPKGWQNQKLKSGLRNSKIRQLEVLVSLLETGTLVHCWWECKMVQSHLGEQFGNYLAELQLQTPTSQQSHSQVCTLEKHRYTNTGSRVRNRKKQGGGKHKTSLIRECRNSDGIKNGI